MNTRATHECNQKIALQTPRYVRNAPVARPVNTV